MLISNIYQCTRNRCLKYCERYDNSKRNIKLDILKGIAIFCVVWGHFIQQGTLNGLNYLDNPIFHLIYSFHMPLFMLISGYLMYHSINKRTVIQQWKHWLSTLVVPLIAWTIITNIFIIINVYVTQGTISNYNFNIFNLYQYWFIYSLLICGFITTIIKLIFKDKLLFFILIDVLILLSTFNLFSIGWMYSFFIGGYLFNKYYKYIKSKLNLLSLVCLIIFPILIMFYNTSSISYSGVQISNIISGGYSMFLTDYFGSLAHNIFKILTGFAGCGLVYCIVEKLTNVNMPIISAILAWFGTESLIIYFVQRIIVEIFIGKYVIASNILLYDFIITFVLAIVSTVVFSYIGTLIHKNKSVNMILSGGR